MENKSTKICRFCLETSDINFETVEEFTFANLDFLWLKLNLSISEEPVMCGNCAKTIENCSDFKTKCLEMENCIASSVVNKDSINIDLREVYVRKMSVEDIVNVPEDNMVCRLCLELVKNDLAIFLRDSTDIAPKLKQYFPELDIACTEDPVICASCQASLQRYFSFTNTCLTSEEKITEYCKVEGTNSMGQIDLNSVIHFISKDFVKCKLEVDTLKIEETGNDDSENAGNNVEIKKEGILDVELDIKEDSSEQESELTDDNSFQHHPSPPHSDCVPQLTRVKSKRTCKICGYQNNSYDLLQTHILAHKGIVQEFNCQMCPFKTTTKRYLENHMLRHKDASEVRMYKCTMCSYQSKRKKQLQLHMVMHQDDTEVTRYKCDLCDYETKWYSGLWRHNMRTHKSDPKATIYKCDLCAYETKYKYYLRKHVQRVFHKDKPGIEISDMRYKCDLCDYKTKRNYDLKRHMLTHKTHSEVTIYKCEMCDYETVHKEWLAKHVVRHMDVSKIKMYKCDRCPFESKWSQRFRKHQIYHGNSHSAVGKPCTLYKCDQCDFETKRRYYLKSHMLTHKTHLEITMYKCYHCDFKTKWKGDLKRHVLAHQSPSNTTMFKCDNCDYESKNKNYLRQHMLVHRDKSEVKMHECKLCSYETKWRNNLRKHELGHQNIPVVAKPVTWYKCDLCDYKTKRNHDLKRHVLTHKADSKIIKRNGPDEAHAHL